MTDEELMVFNQLPERWREAVINCEVEAWLKDREIALDAKRAFSEDGGHIMLMDSVVDPETLPEPFRNRALALLAMDVPTAMKTGADPSF